MEQVDLDEDDEALVAEEYIIEETSGKIYLPLNFNTDGLQILEIDDGSVKIWDDKIQILHTDLSGDRDDDDDDDDESQSLTITPTPSVTSVERMLHETTAIMPAGSVVRQAAPKVAPAPSVISAQQMSVNAMATSGGATLVPVPAINIEPVRTLVNFNPLPQQVMAQQESAAKVRRVPPHMQPKMPSDERFKCPNCTSSYTQLKNLQRHMRLECMQEPRYPCPYCALKCKRNNQLQHHIAMKHRMEMRGDLLEELQRK